LNRKIWLCLICFVQLARAESISDAEKWISTAVPDGWRYDQAQKCWHNDTNEMAVALKSRPLESDLKAWALTLAQPSARAKIEDFTLGGQPAKRVRYVNAAGYQTTIWITAKKKRGALLTLVHRSQESADSVRDQLLGQFRWLR
jgi:hypothetical protein